MANNNETTTRFKVDISELKSQFQEASRQIRLANSEFKAATSGMDDWGKSADGISAKIKQLNSVLESQKKQLENLEKQYELVVQEQGENSKGAEELRIKINNQKAAIGNTEKEIRNYNDRLSEMQSAAEEVANEQTKAKTAMDRLKDTIKEQEQDLIKLKDQYSNLVLEQGESSDEAQELARQIETLSSQLNENRNQLNEAENAADEFDNTLEDLDEEANNTANSGISTFGVALGNLIADVVMNAISKLKELASQTIEVGKQFDSSMSQVKAVSGATGEEYEKLRDKAKEMGSSTKFTASEAADAFNYMSMAGWKTEDMLNGIEGIMNLAAASGADLATTSDIVTDALTAMGYSADDAGQLADVLAAASSNANTNVEMMGETFKYVAPVLGALGYNMEDAAVASGLMANAGIKASQSGTALRSSLTRMAKPTKQMKDMMVKLGLATSKTTKQIDNEKLEKAQNNVANKTLDLEKAQVKYNQAIEKYSANAPQIQIAMNSVETAQINLNKAISQYGENSPQAQKAAIALENAQTRLNDTTKKYSENAPEVQTATLNLQKAKNNLAEAEKKLKTEQEGSAKSTKFQAEILTDADGNMRSLADVMKILREKFKDLDADQQAQAAATLFGQEAMSGMLAIINASEKDFNKLTNAVANSEGAAKDMADTMLDNLGGDMTLLSSKLEGVQLAIYEKFKPALRDGAKILDKLLDAVNFVVEHSDEFIAALTGMATAIGAYLAYTTIMKVMTEGWQALTIVTKAQAAAQAALNFVMSLNPIGLIIAAIAGLVAAFVILWNKSEGFRNFWIGLWDGIVNAVLAVVDWIKENWQALLLFLVNPLAGIFKYMYDHFDGFREFVDNIVQSIIEFFKNLWDSIVAIWDGIADWFKELFTKVLETIHKIVDPWVEIFKRAWQLIKEAFAPVIEWFKDIFKKAWDGIKEAWSKVKEFFTNIWNGIKEIFSVVGSWFKDKFTTAWTNIKKVFDPVKKFFTGIWDGIKEVFSHVSDWFKEKFTAAWEAVKNVFSTGGKIFDGIKDGIINGLKTVVNAIIRGINKVIAVPFNGLNSALRGIKGIEILGVKPFDWINEIGVPQIPELYKGGVLKKGQVGLLEGNGTEAVVPLEKNTKWLDEIAKRLYNKLNLPKFLMPQKIDNSTVNNFYQTNNSPKALSRLEIYRQSKNLLTMKR